MEKLDKWNISELEDFFKGIDKEYFRLKCPIKLSKCETIIDLDRFIKSHIDICKAHNGNLTYKPYFDRLVTLKEILLTGLTIT